MHAMWFYLLQNMIKLDICFAGHNSQKWLGITWTMFEPTYKNHGYRTHICEKTHMCHQMCALSWLAREQWWPTENEIVKGEQDKQQPKKTKHQTDGYISPQALSHSYLFWCLFFFLQIRAKITASPSYMFFVDIIKNQKSFVVCVSECENKSWDIMEESDLVIAHIVCTQTQQK